MMKLFSTSLLITMFFAAQAFGLDQDLVKYQQKINRLREKMKVSEDQLGMLVLNEKSEKVFQLHPTKKMIPASISKLATASAVLDFFPPGSKFKTQLSSAAKVEDGKLMGDLYIKGGGDPSFVSENMWYLVNVFTRQKIKTIEGDLIVDDQMFDQVRFDESRQEERVDRAYDAPVGALSFNWNSVNIFVKPTKSGKPAQVILDPENEYLKLENETKTVSGEKDSLSADRVIDKKTGHEVIKVFGHIGENNKEKVIYKNITQPDLWTGFHLKSFLAQRGITIAGSIKKGTIPDKSIILAEYESKPIEQIVSDMAKFSNNYVAEMLTKNIAAQKKRPAQLKDGTSLINEHLKNIGLLNDEYHFENPSGLTRKNQFSAEGMIKILNHIRKDFRLFPELAVALPIAGIDGTLKKRMKGTDAEGRVRAKTGLLTGVVALAGYVGQPSGDVLTFVFMYNGPKNEAEVRSFFDQCLEVLVQ